MYCEKPQNQIYQVQELISRVPTSVKRVTLQWEVAGIKINMSINSTKTKEIIYYPKNWKYQSQRILNSNSKIVNSGNRWKLWVNSIKFNSKRSTTESKQFFNYMNDSTETSKPKKSNGMINITEDKIQLTYRVISLTLNKNLNLKTATITTIIIFSWQMITSNSSMSDYWVSDDNSMITNINCRVMMIG